jgi:hypothetical protein
VNTARIAGCSCSKLLAHAADGSVASSNSLHKKGKTATL